MKINLSSWKRIIPLCALSTALTFNLPAADTVKVGVLHSLSGTMAISETSLKDVLLFTFDEINKGGGVKVGGKNYMIEPVVVDPASNWPLFAEKAEQLLVKDKVAAVFGCWTSVSRKSCLPVFERNNGLLFYPVQYEGEELSKNIFYTAEAVNQQAIPPVDYMLAEGKKKFYLLGSDYVYPRTTNKILKQYLKMKGIPDSDIVEIYTPFSHTDYQTIVAAIKAFAAGGKACVISTLNGDTNIPFFKEFANLGELPGGFLLHLGRRISRSARQTTRRSPRLLDLFHVDQIPGKHQVRERLPRVGQRPKSHRRGLQGYGRGPEGSRHLQSDEPFPHRREHVEASRREGRLLRGG
jgi:urea transport system substrate-binding protein